MGKQNTRQVEHKDFVAGCPDCERMRPAYDPNRVRRTVRRILKQAMLPGIGEEIINAIERPYRSKSK